MTKLFLSTTTAAVVCSVILTLVLVFNAFYPALSTVANTRYHVYSTQQDVIADSIRVIPEEIVSVPDARLVNPVTTYSPLVPASTTSADLLQQAFGISPDQVSLTLTEWTVPTPSSNPSELAINPSTGNVFFTERFANKIGMLDPSGNSITEWVITSTGNPLPAGITVEPSSSNVFFSERNDNQIARLDTSTNIMTEWNIPTPGSGTDGVVFDPAGNVYFIESGAKKIGRLNPLTNTFTEWSVPPEPGCPGCGVGSVISIDSSASLWFTKGHAKVSKLDPSTNTFTEWDIDPLAPGFRFLVGMALDSSGKAFVTEGYNFCVGCGTVIELDPSGNTVTRWEIPTSSGPTGIVADSLGAVFFGQSFSNEIGRLVQSGGTDVITEWTIPTPSSGPKNFAVGISDDIWFTESGGNKIGRLN